MTSPYYLSKESGGLEPVKATRPQIPVLILESLDGTRSIRLDGSAGWIRMPGSTGLELPPIEVISQAMPGIPGSTLTDVRVLERPVFIPIYASGNGNYLAFREMMSSLYSLIVDPLGRRVFRLIGESVKGSRELLVTYVGGLEGADDAMQAGLSWAKLPLKLVAHSPFAQARADRVIEFRYHSELQPFLGVVGGTDAPFPRTLSTSSVIGENMMINIGSEVPVYPTAELVGKMDSFSATVMPEAVPDEELTDDDDNWSVSVPNGVPAGSTLRMVTDPRHRSFRLDGAHAAGRIAQGSKLRPFYPGVNWMNVIAPGSSEDTRVRLMWRELYRSLW